MPSKTLRTRIFIVILAFLATAISSPSVTAKEDTLRRWPARMATPQIQLTGLDGREWNAKDLRGKVVVLNFWASWCAPCVDEMAYLNDLASGEVAKGKLVILGVNFKESASVVQAFASDHKFDYPILLDKTGDRFRKWADGVLPTTVLIDRRGRPRWRIVGELDRTDASFKKALETLLAEP
jgi:thiol-disulfide isomerase/thioredoxin